MTNNNNTAAIAAAVTFQERMFERVRESLSELLTEDEAKALVERVISESLFKRKEERVGGFDGHTVVKPSMFEHMVLEQVEPMIKEAIAAWLSSHHEEVKQAITGVVEQGIAATVVKVFQAEMRQPMYEMSIRLQQVINKLGGI